MWHRFWNDRALRSFNSSPRVVGFQKILPREKANSYREKMPSLSPISTSVLFQVIPPYLHFTHLPTHSSSPSTILTPPLHSHPTPSPPLPTPLSPLFASPNSALLSISSYLISVLIKCFFFIILAVFTKALCQLMEVMCGPLLQTLENRLQVNLKRTAALETEKEMLEKEINSVKAELQGSMWERETAELFITKIIAENKLKENSVTSERLRCEVKIWRTSSYGEIKIPPLPFTPARVRESVEIGTESARGWRVPEGTIETLLD